MTVLNQTATAQMVGRVDLATARAWLENTPGLSRADQRMVERWINDYERRLAQQRDRHVSAGVTRDADAAAEEALGLKEIGGLVAAAESDLGSGRIPRAEAEGVYQDAMRAVDRARATADGYDANAAEYERVAALDPAEYQAEQLRRLSVLRDRQPAFLGDLPELVGEPVRTRSIVSAGPSLRVHADELYRLTENLIRALEAHDRRAQVAPDGVPAAVADRFPTIPQLQRGHQV